jgi:hypothetical protein
MSLVQGLPGYVTATSGVTAAIGLKKTGFNGPVLAGKVADPGVAGGPIPTPGGYICVQSTASLTNQIVTTSATGLQNASFVYIPVTTGQLQGAAAPPYVGVGVPLVWNDTTRRLMVWSSGALDWLNMSSSGTFSSS